MTSATGVRRCRVTWGKAKFHTCGQITEKISGNVGLPQPIDNLGARCRARGERIRGTLATQTKIRATRFFFSSSRSAPFHVILRGAK
eukprot:872713-Prymnesium_polylepis.1